jgi:hypothetical protein
MTLASIVLLEVAIALRLLASFKTSVGQVDLLRNLRAMTRNQCKPYAPLA